MGYYIRILGKRLATPTLLELQQAADPALIDVDSGAGDHWDELTLKHDSGVPIAVVEKNAIEKGELGGDELREFIDEISYYKPDSAVAWLKEYLPGIQVIYAFQLLEGADVGDGFDVMHRVYEVLWHHAGGILQSDGEGFSNEDGYTILWQFSEKVSGPWNCAVREQDRWVNFEMELGNQEDREAFWRGEIPGGAKQI